MLRRSLSLGWPLIALLPVAVTGCGDGHLATGRPAAEPAAIRPFDGEYPIPIVCTAGQGADMLRHIGGDHVAVPTLMGPGVDPNLRRESPSPIEKLSRADAIFY